MKLGERLIAAGKLNERDLDRALLAQAEMSGYLGQVLIRLGLVAEVDVVNELCNQLGLKLASAADYPQEPIHLESVASDFLVTNQVVPVSVEGNHVRFVALFPQDSYLIKALRLACPDKNIELLLGLETEVNAALAALEGGAEDDAVSEGAGADLDGLEFVEHLRDMASEAPVIRVVNQIIHKAADIGASDIHIEPSDQGLRLRYRVDGVIAQEADPPFASMPAAAIASRIKLLANLDIAERRLPQDGRIMIRVKGKELDLRVATTPTVHGEAIVMRVLDRENVKFSLSGMGFSDDILRPYRALLHRPHGVLLLTGPTGSGKTTTLYASLSELDASASKIITVEDPVEYQLPGINQMQVQSSIGLTFARSLRSILRQDPDIIMIGEMRDTETAQIAVQSALTGHLVLSTLHTNTAAGAITRLEDMGIERYLITSAVNGVLAQRLLRKLCQHCRKPVELDDGTLETTGLRRYMGAGHRTTYMGVGCDRCKGSGYSGRTAIHEIFIMDTEVQELVLNGADASALQRAVRAKGMLSLYENGLIKVADGVTSLEELLRVTQDQSDQELAA
jgi:general secretion pathway protein E